MTNANYSNFYPGKVALTLLFMAGVLIACDDADSGTDSPKGNGKDTDSDGVIDDIDSDGVPEDTEDNSGDHKGDTDSDPMTGDTDFFSADGQQGEQASRNSDLESADGDLMAGLADEDDSSERTVEEGDIYRVLDNSRILNLNAYRGLQVIDFSDVAEPNIMGRLQITGTPVELYVVDDKAIVLMNNWYGYYGARDDVNVYSHEGGVVMLVDLSDPTAPVLLSQAYVEGNIRKSRLTRGGGKAALFVAASYYGEFDDGQGGTTWESRTVVKSFDVSGTKVTYRTMLDLGGYVTDIQATTEALMVASYSWSWSSSGQGSTVTLIDISNPDGTMVKGDEIRVEGRVQNQFNMDLYKGVLRIASGSNWNASNTNHLETFDATDFGNLTPIDHCQFSDGESLYATLLLGNKGFFVTYLRKDPFHAFSITDDGHCAERSEFVVSGWNDFFRAVYDEERLVGIGKNDENGNTMAVSLYDITNLDNPNPLLARAEVAADSSWSEASWDHRAFSVLEDAISVEGPDGVTETGMVLLPFQGWDGNYNKYAASVQIYTFSRNTLTRRGIMDHGTSVRRSFPADSETTANLSEAELSLFDATAPDTPVEIGRLELAPNYTEILNFGSHYVRVKNSADYYSWWGNRTELPGVVAQIIPASGDPDEVEPIAEIELKPSAQVTKAGDKLLGISSKYLNDGSSNGTYITTIEVYDLGNPAAPVNLGTVTSDELVPGYGGGYYGMMEMDIDGYFWGGYGYDTYNVQVVDGAAVFVQLDREEELLGTAKVCYEQPNFNDCWRLFEVSSDADADVGDRICYQGQINCTSLNGGAESCTGDIYECTVDEEGNMDCSPTDSSNVLTSKNCYDQEQRRYWNSYTFHVLNLESDKPAFEEPLVMPQKDEGISVLTEGESLFFSFTRPYSIADDPKSYVRYYFKEIDLSNPGSPVVNKAVNVPGQLIQINENMIYTKDLQWGDNVAETTINKLTVENGLAHRQAVYRFPDRIVNNVALDPAGNVLVSHQESWTRYYWNNSERSLSQLSILGREDLAELSRIDVDSWATLMGAENDKALFQVPGGLLVMNVGNPTAPFPQAYFATNGWPRDILFEGSKILFAAGRYGVYSFSADVFNLLPLTVYSD